VNALNIDQAANQISSSLKKVLPYSVGMHFSRYVQTTIKNHYDAFLDIKNPSKQDLIAAVKDATEDLQLKAIKMIHNSLSKRDLREADLIVQDLRNRKEYLLKNDEYYQKVYNQELELQNSALDQQAADFESFLNSLDPTNEPFSDEPFRKLVLDTVEVQLEKDIVENDILDNDEKLKELHQELVKVDPNHKYLEMEKNSNLETLQRQVSSAGVILFNAYQRVGIKPETWNHLKYLSNRMDKVITSNPAYSLGKKSPVAEELQKIIESAPNSGSVSILITMTALLGVVAPPVLFSMFA
jgi:hypothetical protein